MYLSNNFTSDNIFNFLLDERGISGKFDNSGRFKSIFGDFSSPENLNFKVSLNAVSYTHLTLPTNREV